MEVHGRLFCDKVLPHLLGPLDLIVHRHQNSPLKKRKRMTSYLIRSLPGLPHRIRYGLLLDKDTCSCQIDTVTLSDSDLGDAFGESPALLLQGSTSASDGRLSTKGRAARRALLVPF